MGQFAVYGQQADDQIASLAADNATLATRNAALAGQCDDLISQNKDLAARLAAATATPPVTPPPVTPPASDTRTAWKRGKAWYEANTGPTGTLTASGGITVTTAGTVIENRDVSGQIIVKAKNVTIRNCRVRGIVNPGDNEGLVVDHCDVDVSGLALGSGPQKYAVQSFWNTVVRNSRLHGMCQGIGFSGGVTVEDCWIYGIRSNGTHSECVLSNGDPTAAAGNTTIARNWLDATSDAASKPNVSGALCMYGDNGQIKNIVIDGNYLTGYGYLLYAGAVAGKDYPKPANVEVKNNVFEPKGWGAVYPSALDSVSTGKWAGNTLTNGAVVPAPTGNA